jgi:hypothetical protein
MEGRTEYLIIQEPIILLNKNQRSLIFGLSMFIALLSFKPSEPYLIALDLQ